jgi:hypothetical protein
MPFPIYAETCSQRDNGLWGSRETLGAGRCQPAQIRGDYTSQPFGKQGGNYRVWVLSPPLRGLMRARQTDLQI